MKFSKMSNDKPLAILHTECDEFNDLDIVVKRLKHWAHRLYPKLPFDDVTKQIANLGKKMQVQTQVKRIRLGMDLECFDDKEIVDKDDDPNKDNQNNMDDVDTTERYVIQRQWYSIEKSGQCKAKDYR